MGLSCSCDYDDNVDGYAEADNKGYTLLVTKRRQRCVSCNDLISIFAVTQKFFCWRSPRDDIEERIHGDEVRTATKYMCEKCADMYWSLTELGYCVSIGENMRDLVSDYAHEHKQVKE